jgi:alpha-mannosidase
VTKAAWEYNIPPLVISGKALPEEFYPFKIKGNILPTCFKKALGRDSYILRFVEICGRKQKVTVECAKPVKKIYLADMAERRKDRIKKGSGNIIQLNVSPFEILTLDMEF